MTLWNDRWKVLLICLSSGSQQPHLRQHCSGQPAQGGEGEVCCPQTLAHSLDLGSQTPPRAQDCCPTWGRKASPRLQASLYSQPGHVHLQKVKWPVTRQQCPGFVPKVANHVTSQPDQLLKSNTKLCQLLRQYRKQIIIKTAMIYTAFSMGLFNLGFRWYYYPPFIAEETETQRS